MKYGNGCIFVAMFEIISVSMKLSMYRMWVCIFGVTLKSNFCIFCVFTHLYSHSWDSRFVLQLYEWGSWCIARAIGMFCLDTGDSTHPCPTAHGPRAACWPFLLPLCWSATQEKRVKGGTDLFRGSLCCP